MDYKYGQVGICVTMDDYTIRHLISRLPYAICNYWSVRTRKTGCSIFFLESYSQIIIPIYYFTFLVYIPSVLENGRRGHPNYIYYSNKTSLSQLYSQKNIAATYRSFPISDSRAQGGTFWDLEPSIITYCEREIGSRHGCNDSFPIVI